MLGRGRDVDLCDVNPLTAHILTWFEDLNDGRRFTVVAGMAGGTCIPEALSHQELAAWSQNTGNEPTPWEFEALKTMDRTWRRVYGEKKGSRPAAPADAMQHQPLGGYCKGEDLDECRKTFGAELHKICATCPN